MSIGIARIRTQLQANKGLEDKKRAGYPCPVIAIPDAYLLNSIMLAVAEHVSWIYTGVIILIL